jgi:hypothetical protein
MEKFVSGPLYCFSKTGGYIYRRSRCKRHSFIKAAGSKTSPPESVGHVSGSGVAGIGVEDQATVFRVRGHRRQPGLILSRHAFRLPCTPTR